MSACLPPYVFPVSSDTAFPRAQKKQRESVACLEGHSTILKGYVFSLSASQLPFAESGRSSPISSTLCFWAWSLVLKPQSNPMLKLLLLPFYCGRWELRQCFGFYIF